MFEQEIKENYEELVAMLTEDEKEMLKNSSEEERMITLGLKYLDLKSKRREEERLSKMTLEERKWYEEQEAFQRELEEVCDDIRRRRIEKSEDLDKMTLEEYYRLNYESCKKLKKQIN